ncbi:MAG: hypothetical protein BMS9Abin15_0194 [Gammaproteobacteria bacterium]|nr:MAG: hypothetical protein BMS9Abin15_0194 [Gammaproteobacteria bacterium]
MERARNVEEYVDLVDQALFELDDLRMAAEYDQDSMGMSIDFLDTLEQQVKVLRSGMEEGSYKFEDKDLPFMDVIKDIDDRLLPFKQLFRMINETHKYGLDVGED